MKSKQEYYNIIGYLQKYGSKTVEQKPLNVVDALIFSQLTLLDFNEIDMHEPLTVKKVAAQFFKDEEKANRQLGLILPQVIVNMLKKMGNSKRYQQMLMSNCQKVIDIEKEQQFCALTIEVRPQLKYIVFCSTDDTIVGWKENFNMLYNQPTPSQEAAKAYVDSLELKDDENLVLLGHSKGGNLAMYAHLHCESKQYEKIIRTYNFDGPGFNENVVKSEMCAQRIHNMQAIVPVDSVVGRLLQHYEALLVVQSFEKLLYQHDVFSWCVCDDDLVYVPKLATGSLLVDQKLKEMLKKLTDEEKKDLVETTYHWLIAQGSNTLTELSKIFPKHFPSFFKLEKNKRKLITSVVVELFKSKAVFVGTFKSALEYRHYLKRRLLNEIKEDENDTSESIKKKI